MPQVEQGNIDLTKRKGRINKDGKIETVKSMSFNEDGLEILVPTVTEDGRRMDDYEAINHYHTTGEHLGKFDSIADADTHAKKLHNSEQERTRGDYRFEAARKAMPTR